MFTLGPLSDTALVLSVITTAAFVLTAWMSFSLKNKISWLTATGFLILAGWTAGSSLGQADTPALVGSLLVAAAVIFGQIHAIRQAKAGRLPQTAIDHKVAAVLNQPAGADRETSAAAGPDQDLSPKRTAKLNAGLLAEPLVKLPAARRKQARSIFNVIVGTIVLLLVGWGSYVLAKKVLLSQEDFGFLSEPLDEQPSATPSATSPTPAPTAAEPTVSPTASPTPAVTPLPKVTIKATETGYLNVREGASTATKVIKQIKPGETYVLLEETEAGDWVKIQLNEDTAGWVSAKYVQK